MNWLRKTGHTLKVFAIQAGKSIANISKKIIIAAVVVLVIYIIVIIAMNTSYCNLLKGTCIEADEFGSKKNIIRAKPLDKDSGYSLKNDYKHNEFTQKVVPTDLGLSLNGDPITINLTGEWTPWFGDLSEEDFKNYSTNSNFICAVEKYKISNVGGQTLKFSNREEENEFYYIKNYYSDIKTPRIDKENNKIIIEGVEEPPERQKECWLTGGVGLYLASFGLNGRTEPSAYHHLKADKLICNKAHWFNGKALNGNNLNKNYIITKYNDDKKNYKISDFLINYFSVSYYSDPEGYIENYNDKNWKSSELEYDKGILVETENQIIYNIDVHEKNLEDRLKNYRDNGTEISEFRKNISYCFIIANSITKFMQACYQISKDLEGKESRNYRSYFQYGPKTLYKNMQNVQNIKYEYGEKVKMIILDKYYENNNGFYKIEVISGIELDNADYLEQKIKEVEFYLLGTPNKNNKREDGIIARIFNNVLSSGFVLFAKAILMLYVVYYGFRIIFGFKKDRNDRSVINNKDLMITLVKFIIIAIFLSPAAFSFFSELILSSVIDGTIGIIDLIAGIFSNNFNDNSIALTGGLKYANEVKSLSRNFAIVDEILNFFTDKVILSKVLAFAFNFTQTFGSGLIISIGILLVLLFYVYKLIQSIVPFIFVLLQFTLTLPLAPLFILFILFKETSYIFQNWLKFILSKSLELIGFFTAFYFCTSIINNFIKKLLAYKVCFMGLGDKLFPNVDNKIEATSFSDFMDGNWFFELIKKILNNFLAVSIEGLPKNYFLQYMINILITAILVFMFDILLREIMNIINSILTIDGATANTGGKNAMAAAASGEFSLDRQFIEFNKTMGLATIQKESNILKGTSGILDLEKGITRNVIDLAKNSALLVKAGAHAVTGNLEKAKESLAKGGMQILSPVTGALSTLPFVGDKVTNWTSDIDKYKDRRKRQSSWSDTMKQIKGIWSINKNKSEVNTMLSEKTSWGFKKHLKTLDEYTAKKIFGKEMSSKILDNIDNLGDVEIKRIKDYLQRYAGNEYMKAGMEDLNYDIFSDDYGRLNKDLLVEAIDNGDKDNILKTLKRSNKKTIIDLFGKKNADRLKKVKKIDELEFDIEDIDDLEDYVIENMQKYLIESNNGHKKLYDFVVNRDVTSEDYGRENKFVTIDDVLLSKEDKEQFKTKLKRLTKNNNELAEELFEDKIEAIKNKDLSDDEIREIIDTLENESKKELNLKKDGEDISVTEGENKYKISLFSEDDGIHKKGEPAAIFNEDSTVIFEVKDADCIVKVDGIQYIVTSTKGSGDVGTIVDICRYKDSGREELTAAEKTAELQARIEKKMQKFNKMMEEARKLDEDGK